MSDSIERLCGEAKTGNRAAASELLTLFYAKIFVYFRRLCGSDGDAEDLTQKTFLKVWLGLSTYQGRSTFSTWIHGIAHHVYVDWLRRCDRLDPQPDKWWETRVAEGPSPFDDAAERETAHQLYALVDLLDEGAKEAVHLHYYQGLSLSETAEALGIATSTVKYRLRGALDFIRVRAVELKQRTA